MTTSLEQMGLMLGSQIRDQAKRGQPVDHSPTWARGWSVPTPPLPDMLRLFGYDQTGLTYLDTTHVYVTYTPPYTYEKKRFLQPSVPDKKPPEYRLDVRIPTDQKGGAVHFQIGFRAGDVPRAYVFLTRAEEPGESQGDIPAFSYFQGYMNANQLEKFMRLMMAFVE